MNKEVSSDRQIIAMMILFLIGNTLMGIGYAAKQDAWLSVLLSLIMAAPMFAVYARLAVLYPGFYFFEMMEQVFSSVVSRILTLYFSCYCFLTAAIITRNFSEFLHLVALPETPDIVSLIMMGLVIIYAVKNGSEVIGRYAQLYIWPVLLVLVVITLLSLTVADPENLRPVLYNGLTPILYVATECFFFPFGELVVFLSFVSFTKDRNKPFRVFFYSLIFGGALLIIVVIRNVLVLGPEMVEQLYFPSYNVAGLINIGKFFQRLESSVALIFFSAGFVKTAVCMIAFFKGIQYVFRLEHYRQVAAPFGLLFIIICRLVFKNMMQIYEYLNFYHMYFAFPFQLLLPLVVWIKAEMKMRKDKMQNEGEKGQQEGQAEQGGQENPDEKEKQKDLEKNSGSICFTVRKSLFTLFFLCLHFICQYKVGGGD